jgi:hypothetical protein
MLTFGLTFWYSTRQVSINGKGNVAPAPLRVIAPPPCAYVFIIIVDGNIAADNIIAATPIIREKLFVIFILYMKFI